MLLDLPSNGSGTEAAAIAAKSGDSDSSPPALFHRSLKQRPYKVVAAKGIYLTLESGRVVMDACGGAAVACIGHGNDEVREAVHAQMGTGVNYVHTVTYTTDAAEELARHLIDGPERKGGARYGKEFGLEKAYFVGSGSEAMDAALKMARQYWWEVGQPRRAKFVARRQSYHGATIGAMNVGHFPARKEPFACFDLETVSWVGPAYTYQYSRWQEGETEAEYADRLVAELDDHFVSLGPDTVAAFVAEPLVGATSGCTPAPAGYFAGVRAVCDKHSILLLLDEIMCGIGRTGTLFAFEQEHVRPDIVTVGKGLGGGYTPMAGVLVGSRVVDGIRQGKTSGFTHGHTYQAHPVCSAATLAVQQILAREGLVERCRRVGTDFLHPLLTKTFGAAKYVGDIRGRGLFWGVEFVRDKATRASFPPSVGFGPRFQQLAFDLGVAVYPGAGTVDGTRGDHAIVSPPYNTTEEELTRIVDVMKQAYDRLEREVDQAENQQGEN
jgi:adenosylmethionine-8-amino-7-oxononanoate aminotransferase